MHQVWRTWCERADGEIRGDLDVILDLKQSTDPPIYSGSPGCARAKKLQVPRAASKGGVAGLDISYGELKSHLEKGLLLTQNRQQSCAVCSKKLPDAASATLVCPRAECSAISHLTCLAKHLAAATGIESVLPLSGNCPLCKVKLQWIDLVKELSLRSRGTKEMNILFKKPRVPKPRIAKGKHGRDERPADIDCAKQGDLSEPTDEDDVVSTGDLDEDQPPDDWLEQCNDDSVSVASTESEFLSASETHSPAQASSRMTRLAGVIEDSEWDNADILD